MSSELDPDRDLEERIEKLEERVEQAEEAMDVSGRTLIAGDEQSQQRRKNTNVKRLVELVEDYESTDDNDWSSPGAPIEDVVDIAEILGIQRSKAEHEIEKLRRQGEVYEPQTDHLKVT